MPRRGLQPEEGTNGACLGEDPCSVGVCDAVGTNPDGGLPLNMQTACGSATSAGCGGQNPNSDDPGDDDPPQPPSPPGTGGHRDPNHPKGDEDDVCSAGGPQNGGDPFLINGGGTFHRVVDATLKSSLGDFQFTRKYASRDAVWGERTPLGGYLDAGVPAPFGWSPVFPGTNGISVRWWHNLYSFVYPEGFTAGSSRWQVRLPSGRPVFFTACSPGGSGCFAALEATSRESRHQLHWSSTSNTFTLFMRDGRRYIYSAVWQSGAAGPRYFLSRIDDAQYVGSGSPRTLVQLAYAVPDAGACPFPGAGGVPYLATATNTEGTQLRFHYQQLEAGASALAATECVMSRVSLGHASASGDETVARYTYSNADGGQRAGLLKTAWRPGGSDAGYLLEQYDVDYTKGRSSIGGWSGAFSLKNKHGQTLLKHDYFGGAVKQETLYPGSGTTTYTVGGLSTCYMATGPYNRAVQQAGAGQTCSAYLFVDAGFARGQRSAVRSTQGYQTNPASLGPGVETWTWADLSTSSVVNLAHQEKVFPDGGGGTWNGRTAAVATSLSGAGLSTVPFEVTSSFVGATSSTGTSALQTTSHAYDYGSVGQSPRGYPQLKTQDERASVLSPGNTTATIYVNDTTTNRLKAVIRRGYTQVFDEGTGAFSTVQRFIGTFYFTSPVCSAGSADALGRTVETHGPCLVTGTSATDCDVNTTQPVPITRYDYFASGSGANSLRLQAVHHYVDGLVSNCSTARRLTTTYGSYDNRGNPGTVTDPNGVVTQYTYEEESVKTETVASPDGGVTREFFWDDGVLFAVRNPEGELDVTCYRQGGGGSVSPCRPGVSSYRRPVPTYRAKMPDLSSSAYSEAISYSYVYGTTLSEERYLTANGATVSMRTQHKSDLRGNSVERQLSQVASYERRVFDGANDMVGLGINHQSVAAFCGGLGSDGRPTSSVCAALSYDRAHRLTALDVLRDVPAATSRTCFEYDAHGNVKSVRSGCTATGSDCSSCGQPTADYQHDDFGNLVAATLPWTSNGAGGAGVTRYAFNALGNPIHEQTPSMRATAVKDFLRQTYDALGRKTKAEAVHDNSGTPTIDTLHAFLYDDVATPHSSCPQPAFSKGRVLKQTDSFGDTWFQYDFAGRVLSEVRLRTGITSCSGASPNDVPHTSYTYTRAGNVSTITYPFGRKFTFTYGTYAAPYASVSTGRVRSVSATKWNGTSWTNDAAWQNVISNVEWWPYAGIRGYQIKHPVTGTLSGVEQRHGQADVAQTGTDCASLGGTDTTGRMRALYVSSLSSAWSPGAGTGDILRRVLTWNGDMPVEARSCLLGVTTARRESYTYDSSGRLTNLSRPAGNWPASGGPHDSRTWTFDKRGNRLAEVADGITFTLAYDGGLVDQATKRSSGVAGSNLQHLLQYDVDGRVSKKSWPYPPFLTSGPVYSHAMSSALQDGVSHGGLDSVYRSFSAWTATYEYFYDANNRRRLKEYPSGARDEYFYSLGSAELMVDRGNNAVTSPTNHPIDEYLWLGGRPVLIIRGRMDTSFVRSADGTTSCGRNGGGERCGVYSP